MTQPFRPGGNKVPNYRAEIDALKLEIRKLWMALGAGRPLLDAKEIVFSWSDTLTLGGNVTSAPWIAWTNLELTGCIMCLAVANNVDTTIDVLVGDVIEATVVLDAGETVLDKTIRIDAPKGRLVQIRLRGSSSGSGSHLSVSLRSQVALK
jgi:hypothetical protein